jgi:predicted MPP superfamily phosphohydrolase
MITRRRFLATAAVGATGFLSLGGYAVGVEPRYRLTVTRHDLALPGWPADQPPLTLALIADLHAIEPWMPVSRIAEIVAATNALGADAILLLGDYMSAVHFARRIIRPTELAEPLARLSAPLGVHAILGNHDYWWSGGPEPVVAALQRAGISVYLNRAARLEGGGRRFWLSGTESFIAERRRPGEWASRADLRGTLAGIDDDLPIIHMAHEPHMFNHVPARVALTLSGHTHGGQIALPGMVRVMQSRTYNRDPWIRGHYEVDGRHLLVSSGIGVSFLPVRFMIPPEINLVHIRSATSA